MSSPVEPTPASETVKDLVHPNHPNGVSPTEKPPTIAEPLVDPKPVVDVAAVPGANAEKHTLDTPAYPARSVRSPVAPGYEILEELGRGGMGVVYKARQTALNRIVAMKAVKDADIASPAELSRFVEEAEAVAAIDHPNVVRVHDYGEHQRSPYLVMEYLSGGALAGQLKETGRFDPIDAAILVAKIAQGVQAAHALGIVHRDLKPHNILFDSLGEPKITDFGLARRMQSFERTISGAIIGTPEYMAPEQACGRAKYAGTPADVWALGVILYECLTGTRPFTASADHPRVQQALVVFRQIECDPPIPPRILQPAVPRDLELICLKCLEKDPKHRYATAAALADDLNHFLNQEPVSVRAAWLPERLWKWSRRNKTLAALNTVIALATVCLIGLGFWFSNRVGEADGKAAAADADRRSAQDLAATQAYYRLLTELRDRPRQNRIGWTTTGLNGIRRVVGDGLPPTARRAELRTEAANCLVGVDLAEPRELLSDIDISTLAYHPAGKWIAVGQSKAQAFVTCNVLLIDPSSGAVVQRLSFEPSFAFQVKKNGQDGPRSSDVSPDGRWLVVGTRSGRVQQFDLAAESPITITGDSHTAEVTQIVCAVDGSGFFTGSTDGTLKRWAFGAKTPTATWTAPGPINTVIALHGGRDIACGTATHLTLLTASQLVPSQQPRPFRIGRIVELPSTGLWAVADGNTIRSADPRTQDDQPIRTLRVPDGESAHDDTVRHIAVNPDGTLLASCSVDHHVRIWDLVGGRLLIDLPIDVGLNGAIGWHPTGRSFVLAASGRVLHYDLTGHEVQAVVPLPTAIRGVAWSPDGAFLAGAAASGHHRFDEFRIWETATILAGHPVPVRIKQSLHANNGVQCSTDASTALSFSPDGTKLALRTQRGVAIFQADTGQEVRVLPAKGPNGLSWATPDRTWAAADTLLQAWSMPDGKPAQAWSNKMADRLTGKGTIKAVAAGREHVVAGCRNGTVNVLRQSDATVIHTAGGKFSVECVALSPDESLAAMGNEAGEVRVFRVPGGEIVGQLPTAHREAVTATAFVTNQLLATGSRDGTVRFWAWASGGLSEVFSLRTTGSVIDLAASRDGTRLAAAVAGELGVRVWRLDKLREQLMPQAYE